ncbi:hypothetical protein [Marinicella litoralis]|uniref:Uncharacterized protein n=1 Tax=Marinicella litoralis TaxID=644220 RepID=A0A4R6XYF3_9GAMM|nr:hypothetical protein [Marinicella litoralis]TDR23334.1 hypothetical protein C8D91_0194 [Marinicella litoralis]
MVSASAPDQTELAINGFDQAIETLSCLPDTHHQLNHWNIWCEETFAAEDWKTQLAESMTIAYARMALRNGLLSKTPRSYHNENHINDLLLRIMYCAGRDNNELTNEGLALLSFFAACHDLRQAEPRKSATDDSLVGANETASYLEALRIIELTNHTSHKGSLWNDHNLLLLKTMIEGSTFGSGGKRSKNFFQGNLAKHLLEKLNLQNEYDNQLVLLACDIDTANVSLPIAQFAESAIQIYDELISHQKAQISAHYFFCQQQHIYFFEQQSFHATLSKKWFQPHKDNNRDNLIALSQHIASLPQDLPATEIKNAFRQKAFELGRV